MLCSKQFSSIFLTKRYSHVLGQQTPSFSSCQKLLSLMSTFYLCSKNHSIVGQMDTYLAFHRDNRHRKTEDHEKDFNPPFPSRHNVSEESARPNYVNHSPTSPYHLGRDVPSDEAINKIRTANSVTISPELFEKIYLNPQNAVKGELRNTFANPTPLALLGFLLSLSPLSCELMGWRGAGGDGIATVGAYYFVGGFLMSLGGILEFFLGNTFSFVVFCSFGAFFPSSRRSNFDTNLRNQRGLLVHAWLDTDTIIQCLWSLCVRSKPACTRTH